MKWNFISGIAAVVLYALLGVVGFLSYRNISKKERYEKRERFLFRICLLSVCKKKLSFEDDYRVSRSTGVHCEEIESLDGLSGPRRCLLVV